MKSLNYILILLLAVLSGFAVSSCDDDDVVAAMVSDNISEGTGETVKVTFSVGITAPNVGVDAEAVTRSDNANIEFSLPENGGRFQNLVVVLVGPVLENGDDNVDKNNLGLQRIYGVYCKKWYNGSDPLSTGVKSCNVVFTDVDVPKKDVTKGKQYTVYAFGNLCDEFYNTLNSDRSKNASKYTVTGNQYLSKWTNFRNICLNMELKADDVYKINFKPGSTNYYATSAKTEYYVNKSSIQGCTAYKCTGMPVNGSAVATIVKGNTDFSVGMKRVCARMQVTFRNFTGQTDYDSYYGADSKGNRVYVDNFVLKKSLAKSTKLFYNGEAPSSKGSEDFDILQALGGSKTNDHKINMVEKGEDLVVSMYLFESTGGYTYDMKVDRGKSLGNRAGSLQDGNVYVMWSDNLDEGSKDWKNTKKVCLGANSSNEITLQEMKDAQSIPYGTGDYGNGVFWKYTGKKFENCKVNLATDVCNGTNYFIKSHSIRGTQEVKNREYPLDLGNGTNNAQTFDEVNGDNFTPARKRLKITSGISHYLQISKDKLYDRYISSFLGDNDDNPSAYPWVFFAKYIIKNDQPLSTGTGTSKTPVQNIERNGSYELDFSVMPNYDDKEELFVTCVRKQNVIDWEEVEK